MVDNPPAGMPRITPYLLYHDVERALRFLAEAFGFGERMRLPGADGRIMHAEMNCADGVVMMGNPGTGYRNPKEVGETTQMLYVYVDDVDAHWQRARAAGAPPLARRALVPHARAEALWPEVGQGRGGDGGRGGR